ncbi:MAG TPA: phospho-sugar mutase [Cyclobacteriaceae bacterium]|jgi:phosphoglucomutase|nr:phospho-sugar mutase [Cyclobacteriaceae bacterium]
MPSLLENATAKAKHWLNSNIDEASKEQVKKLLADKDPKELIDSFYKDLEFGTGGLRGIMGVGANCMNQYTVGAATQGLANYLKKSFPSKQIQVAIAYDSRNNSKYFAQVTANVFSANGILVHLFSDLRPTPLLSFAIRHLKCDSGVVVTASHNPKEYNGYKAYWNDGAQLVPPHDKNVITEVSAITSFDQIKFTADPSKIKPVSSEVEEAYYKEVINRIPRRESIQKQKNISLVYTSIHGAGITMVPECLKRLGFENLNIVQEQKTPDGNFPTVQSPNPEEKSAMQIALNKAKELNAELVMATDPDTDRVGLGIKNDKGEFFLLNGNQAFSLMMWFILKNLKEKKDAYIAKTIVTTELVDDMARNLGVECYNTLTGFKYIAELMGELDGKKKFIAAGEESYGYMVGDFVRDKDAVSACAFFAAMAAAAKDDGQTLYDWLIQMYIENGFYKEGLINLVRKGADGEQQIKAMMEKFRNDPPQTLAGEKIIRLLDYKTSIEKELSSGKTKPITLPKSDVLQFYTEQGSKISVRPSGTEPKIKFYVSIKSNLKSKSEFEKANAELEKKIANLAQALN